MPHSSHLITATLPAGFVPASRWQRFGNYLLDGIFSYLAGLLFLVILAMVLTLTGHAQWLRGAASSLLVLLVTQLYYFVPETASARTLGKLITRTRVVMADGSPPTVRAVFLRCLCRWVPLDLFSFLSAGRGLHDTVTRTRVVRCAQ